MPENIRDCVPVLAGAELTGKINVYLFLFFLNCLRAVLAVAEAINYPCECLPLRARLLCELPLATPNPWKDSLARTEHFSYLCSAQAGGYLDWSCWVAVDVPSVGGTKPLQLSSPSPPSMWGCCRPSPYSYFYHRFLKSHYSAIQFVLRNTTPEWSQGSQRFAHTLGMRRGSLLQDREGKKKISSTPELWKVAVCCGSKHKPCRCQNCL